MIPRFLELPLFDALDRHPKAILLLGARGVGKTTLLSLIRNILQSRGETLRHLNCDLEEERHAADTSSAVLHDYLSDGIHALLIEEIQRLENPGLTLKTLVDRYPELKLLVTGSTVFGIRKWLRDELTGRYIDFQLYPLSLLEVLADSSVGGDPALLGPAADALLDDVLRYGLYPEIYLEANPAVKQTQLSRIVESHLFKDLLASGQVRFAEKIVDLAKALAYRIGNVINEHELANRFKLDRKTILNYIDLLEKSFIVFRLNPYSHDPSREIGKHKKIYFVDVGIRNALIGDFNELHVRPDTGALWENFLIVERYKHFANQGRRVRGQFWRTYNGAEVDYVETGPGGELRAFEFKFGGGDLSRGAGSFAETYETGVELVNRTNYIEFIQGR